MNIADKEGAIIILLASMATAGLVLEALYFLHLLGESVWIIYVAASLVVLPALIVNFVSTRRISVLFIVICSVFYYGMYTFRYSGMSYAYSRDALFHWETVKLIVGGGRIPLGQGISTSSPAYDYSFYPGAHVFLAVLSMITTLDPLTVINLFPLVMIAAPMIIYLITREFFDSAQIAGIAAVIFIFNPSDYPFPSYRYFALVLFLLFFLSLISSKLNRMKKTVLTSVFLFVLSISHAVTTYLTLGLVIFIFVFNIVSSLFERRRKIVVERRRKIDFPRISYILFLVLLLSWSVFGAYAIFSSHILQGYRWSLETSSLTNSARAIMTGYSGFEKYFDQISIICVLCLGTIGFFQYLRAKPSRLFLSFVIYVTLFFLIFQAVQGINEAVNNLATRTWSFLFMGLSPLVAFSLGKYCWKKLSLRYLRGIQIAGCMLLLCFCIASVNLIKPYYDFQSPAMSEYGEQIVASVRHYVAFSETQSIAVGDSPVHDFGLSLNRTMRFYWNLYYNSSEIGENFAVLRSQNVQYVFVDFYMSIAQEQYTWGLTTEKAPNQTLIEIGQYGIVNRIYDNGLVQIIELGPGS